MTDFELFAVTVLTPLATAGIIVLLAVVVLAIVFSRTWHRTFHYSTRSWCGYCEQRGGDRR